MVFLANMNAIGRPSVVCLSVTLVRLTKAVEIFGNISTAFGRPTSLAKFYGDRPRETPPAWRVKRKRGSQI